MANICLYKIKVKGTKKACHKLIHMMPLYSGDKDVLREEGTDENYELVFTGDCKWSVDSYTKFEEDLKPYTDEELDKVRDGYGWNYPLTNKSTLLDCEIFCNSKDIDDCCYAVYEHYNKGIEIFDECPKELHIKRGRDYDEWYDPESEPETSYVQVPICKVRFEDGRAYWYTGDFKVGDLVLVKGAKEGCLGIVKETKIGYACLYEVIRCIKNIELFKSEDIENIWSSYKAKERREYLNKLGLDEKMAKKKFLSVMESKWVEFAREENDWEKFIESIKK